MSQRMITIRSLLDNMEVFMTLGNSDPESCVSVIDFQASGRRVKSDI